ncbi:MAG: hypothetical protein NVS3B19_14680 [Ginsengibacter sp.]
MYSKIRQIRLAKRLTQLELSKQLHICQNTYSLLETGKTPLDNERILQLAELLNVDPKELLPEEELARIKKIYGSENSNEMEEEILHYRELIKYYQQLLIIKDKQLTDQKIKLKAYHNL